MAVPTKRLSFVTPTDQQQFGQLFQSGLRAGENAMDGDTARVVLMRSQLSNQLLGDIWQLSDTTRSGTLLFPEFCLAMSLCAAVRRGESLPRELHPGLVKEIGDMVDQISFGVPDSQPNDFDRLRQQQTGWQQQNVQQQPYQQQAYQYPQATGYGFQAQPTGYQPTGFQSQPTGFQPQATGGLQPQTTGGLQPQTTGGHGLEPQTTSSYGIQPQTTGSYGLQPQMTGGYGLQPQTTGGYGLQPQTTGSYGLQPQTTGGYGIQPQTTGGLQPQTTGGYTGLPPQTTGGLQSQSTGYSLQPQTTGGMQPQSTGYSLQPQTTGGLQPQSTGYLSSQPTGKPGQWGFSNQATPGIENFVGVFTGQGQTNPQQQQSSNTIGTAISKTEKAKYDEIFASWDPQRSGFISGASAIQNFSKSGLPQQDLEQVWSLSDPTDRGKLNRDELAVAMHLIYRRLNGYDIPQQLPPELLPPSSRHLQDSLNQVKQFLKNAPTGTGTNGANSSVSYLKSNSFASTKPRKDATVFRNDDQAAATYKSANRHKAAPKPNKPESMQPNSLAELAKAIKEKKVLLEAMDAEDEEDQVAKSSIERDNQKAVEELKLKIRNVQKDLDKKQPKGAASEKVDKRKLLSKLEGLTDALPQLTMSIRKVEQDIAIAKVEVVRKKYEKEHPGFQLQGTGPGGEITEHDRAAARRKAELRARMSAITGRQLDGSNSYEEFEKILLKASQQAAQDRETNEQSLRALEESTRAVKRDLDHQLRDAAGDMKEDRDRRRWDEAIGVEPEVKAFIEELKPSSSGDASTSTSKASSGAATPTTSTATSKASSSTAPTDSVKETPAERVARIRAEAERRTRERFAKAGIQMRGKRENGQDSAPEAKSEPKPEAIEAKSEPKKEATEPKPELKPEAAQYKPEPKSVPEPAHTADSSDDEESAQLQRENEEMQRRLREKEEEAKARKAAKAKEKSDRLAELKRQQEEMKKREAFLSAKSDSEDEFVSNNPFGKKEADTPRSSAPTPVSPQFKPPQPKIERKSDPQPKVEPKVEPPKAVLRAPAAATTTTTSTTTRAAPNPFGPRPGTKATTDDDDWGSGNDDSDDDGPGRANAAQLASMLFGSMGGAPPRATESPPVSHVAQPVAQQKAPSVPVVSLAESHPGPVAPQEDAPPAPRAPEASALGATSLPSEPLSVPPAPPSEPLSVPPAPPSEPFSAPPAPPSEPFSAPPPPPASSLKIPGSYEDDDFVSADEDFEEPPSAPPAPPGEPPSAPPAPPSAPPAPPSAPPAPPSAPPAPPSAPPAPPSAPPAPPSAPPAPPSAPPAPPSAPAASSVPAMPAGMAGLLGDITKGKKLRKVDPSQQKIASNDLGKVL